MNLSEYNFIYDGPFHPPPWNIWEYPEKTEGWVECQRAIKRGDFIVDLDNEEILE